MGSPAAGYGVETVSSNNLHNNYQLLIVNYQLEQNYPNPFNPVTKIHYQLGGIPATSDRGSVFLPYKPSEQLAEIVVYNALGKQVWSQILTTDHSSQFTGYCTFDGSAFNSGVYYYSLIVDGKNLSTKSMILIK